MSPEKAEAVIGPTLEGRAKGGRSADLADFDNAPYVRVSMGEDLAKCRDALRPGLALYIGGMGARSRNFYNDLAKRIGYEAAAAEIQDLFLDGKRNEAAAAVPDALIDEISLIPGKCDQIAALPYSTFQPLTSTTGFDAPSSLVRYVAVTSRFSPGSSEM